MQIAVAAFIGMKFGVDRYLEKLTNCYTILLVMFNCIYMASFAWSWDPLGRLVLNEIFSLEVRSGDQNTNVSMNNWEGPSFGLTSFGLIYSRRNETSTYICIYMVSV